MSLTLGKPVIKAQFMDDEMREFAIVEALKALENGYNEKVSECEGERVARGLVHEVVV